MEQKKKVAVTIGILAVLTVVFYFSAMAITKYTGFSITGNAISPAEIETLAKCLSDKGAKLYGAFWCGHCQSQKEMFKESWKYVDYAECDPRGENPQSDLCLQKGIEGYPAWEINGKMYDGELSLKKLAEISGCKF